MTLRRILAVLAVILGTGTAALAISGDELGKVDFANSCAIAVQPQLQRAMALLHSFWWDQGERAFRDVLRQDPSCAIAQWGIAAIKIGNPFATGPTPADASAARAALAQSSQ